MGSSPLTCDAGTTRTPRVLAAAAIWWIFPFLIVLSAIFLFFLLNASCGTEMSSRQGCNPLQHASWRAGNIESQGQAISGDPWLLSSSETCSSGPMWTRGIRFYQCPQVSLRRAAGPSPTHQCRSDAVPVSGAHAQPIGVQATGIPSGGPRPQSVLLRCCRYHYGIIQSTAGLTARAARLGQAGSRQG